MYGHLLVMSVINIVMPFTLITVGEQSIDSALASILNATVPLGVIVIAPFFLPEERITPARIAGLAVGFAGVILLVAPDLVNLGDSDLTGELLLLGLVALVRLRRRLRTARTSAACGPMIPALFQVTFAAGDRRVARGHRRPAVGDPEPAPEAIVAVIWLGILGSGVAYLCYFFVLQHWGATRTSMVAYVLPVVGIALGSVVLGDPITFNRIAGTALVLAGVALVNGGAGGAPRSARGCSAAPSPDPVEAAEAG